MKESELKTALKNLIALQTELKPKKAALKLLRYNVTKYLKDTGEDEVTVEGITATLKITYRDEIDWSTVQESLEPADIDQLTTQKRVETLQVTKEA